MANVSLATLGATASGTDASSYTHGFTATSGRVRWVVVENEKTATATTPTVSDDIGGSYTQITALGFDTAASSTRKLTAFWGTGGSGAGTLTADFGGTNQRSCIIAMVEGTNVDTTTPDVVANRQTAVDDTGDTAAPEGITFGAFGSTENRPLVFTGGSDNQTITPNAGADTVWVELSDTQSTLTAGALHVMWADATSDTTPSGTAAGAIRTAIIAIEVQAAVAAGGDAVPVCWMQYRPRFG